MDALNARALACCGLALTGDRDAIAQATESLTRATAVTTAAGVVDEVRRLYAVLAAHDETSALAPFDRLLDPNG